MAETSEPPEMSEIRKPPRDARQSSRVPRALPAVVIAETLTALVLFANPFFAGNRAAQVS